MIPVMDMLNKRYRRHTVRLAESNPKGRWRTKADEAQPALHDEAAGGAAAQMIPKVVVDVNKVKSL